jgi:hypothetical protein
MKDFRELKVWQKAHALTPAAYRATARFPREELYGLMSQIRPLVFICSGEFGRRMRTQRGC